MKSNQVFYLFFAAIAIVFGLAGCDSSGGKNTSMMPRAKGEPSEVILVMDSTLWNGELGVEVRRTFSAPVPGLLQDEPLFSLKQVHPLNFVSILRQARNIIFVTVLENNSKAGQRMKSYFTQESLDRIRSESDLYMLTKEDEFAQGQKVLHLFGNTEEELMRNLVQHREALRDYFMKIEINRIQDKLFAGTMEKNISKMLKSNHDFTMKIPYGYKVSMNEDNFVWLRQLDREVEKNIYVYYEDYRDEKSFNLKPLVDLRDKIGETYIYDIEDKEVFMTTETLVPLDSNRVNFNNKFAVSLRGMWKLSKNALGGAFVSYAFVDEELNRFYYIEGYIVNPGKKKRDVIREMMAILNTFKTTGESQANA